MPAIINIPNKMRNIVTVFVLATLTFVSASCVESSDKYKELQSKLEALQAGYDLKAQELDEIFSVINEVEQGLSSIRESENIITIQAQDTDGIAVNTGTKEQIKNDIKAIEEAIKHYQDKIEKLTKENKIQSSQFKKRLKALQKELKEKSDLISSLSDQLNSANTQLNIKTQEVASLNEVVANLKDEVTSLNTTQQELSDKVAAQDKELYSAYYIVGTKDELIDIGVMTKGGLFKSAKVSYQSEKDAFVKIDYREVSSINTNAKKVKIMSVHPKGTYAIEEADGVMILNISHPDEFWEQTKYLVVQVQ